MAEIQTTAAELQPGDEFTHRLMRVPATVESIRAWGSSSRNRYYAPGTRVLNIETPEFGRIQLAADRAVTIYNR